MSKKKIIEIIEWLIANDLLSKAPSTTKVLERFKNSKNQIEMIEFLLSSGKPKGEMECRSCKKYKSTNSFSFYLSRIDKEGYLMRSNALCNKCSNRNHKLRTEDLDNQNIPDRPPKGSLCPNCHRNWSGNWHRHHNKETGEFLDWICSNCNMALHDQRNPHPKYGR
jgi:hypothetical protein